MKIACQSHRFASIVSGLALPVLVFTLALAFPVQLRAQVESLPPILQFYEAKWDVIEDRMADVFEVGYGGMWVPPVARAGSEGNSGGTVGYDVFDRFDLGSPGSETHYGTGATFGSMVGHANRATIGVFPDLIVNHDGFANRTNSSFVTKGGYPGFALTLPGVDINGDFHDPFLDWTVDPVNGQLFGLNDIAQEKNHQFYRHPVSEGDPDNIPAGTIWNKPNASNTQFYPDQGLGGTSVSDPELGQNVTLYDFNLSDPYQGDPILENAVGLLMRNTRWMIQKYGVKGFRVDAAKHSPEFTLDYIDQAIFRAITELQLDGSYQPAFMFSEVADSNKGLLQSYIRQDLPDKSAISPSNTTVGGNRDVLDFPLFWAMKDNLTSNGFANNWHNIRGASQDSNDRPGINGNPGSSEVWHTDGSQGVAFVQSHDDTGAYLENVAYAYTLMRPGNALVYFNANQFGPTSFPQPGKVDALGGFYGETITKLVEIRNSHGRGDFSERWIDDAFNPNGFSNIYIYERGNSALVGLNSRLDAGFDERTPVQTEFDAGTILVELTGNAADPTVDPGGNIPESIKVNASGQVTVRVPRNSSHGRGYVIYGLPTPDGSLNVTNVALPLAGGTPMAGTNGITRLADIDVIRADTFNVRLSTAPVSVPDPDNPGMQVRDYSADGDTARFKFDSGIDLNNLPGVDKTTPGSVDYGFEEFTDIRISGYIDDGNGNNIGTGTGTYEQTIDATQLAEGRHYITTRAYRQRDNGPAVFQDLKKTIYIDRLPPDCDAISFDTSESTPGNPNNRDLVVESVDQTANGVHIFLDFPESFTDVQMIARALAGQNKASEYDTDRWNYSFFGVTTGNHVATVVTFEPTYDGTNGVNVQRFPGFFTDTNIGAGFGDLDADNVIEVADLEGLGNASFEDVLYSQNSKFRAAADIDGDGDVDNLDLFALGLELAGAGATQPVLDAFDRVLLRRGDINQDGMTNGDDVIALHAAFGTSNWLEDLNVDGVVNIQDVQTLISDIARTVNGDFDLDRDVDGGDFLTLQTGMGTITGSFYNLGDADLNGTIDRSDLAIWEAKYGTQGIATPVSETTVVPEPCTLAMILSALGVIRRLRWIPLQSVVPAHALSQSDPGHRNHDGTIRVHALSTQPAEH